MVKGFTWVRKHWDNILIAVVTALITKYAETGDLWLIKAGGTAVVDCLVWMYNGLLSSVSVHVWLLVLVVGLALIPVWQLAKRVRLAATVDQGPILTRQQTMVLGAIQLMDEARKYNATLQAVAEHTTLSLLETETALDMLVSIDFISRSYPTNSPSGYTVLPVGRSYLLEHIPPAASF